MEEPGTSSAGIPDSERVVEALRASGALEHLRTLAIEALERDVSAGPRRPPLQWWHARAVRLAARF